MGDHSNCILLFILMKYNQFIVLVIFFVFHTISFASLGQIADWDNYNNKYSKSNVFDSYYESTDLEDYPEVCSNYSDENCAKTWLEEINKIVLRNQNRMANAEYRYSSNINKRNLEVLNNLTVESVKLWKLLIKKGNKFNWKLFRLHKLKQIFEIWVPFVQSKNESISKRIIEIENSISFIYNNGKPCVNNTCLKAGESGIIDLFLKERDYDKLTDFWKSWENVTGTQIKNLFIEKMNLENIEARESGHSDAASFILNNDFEENDFNETVLKLYENILPLYKELHAYVRYCLSKYYPGRFDKTGPIPAHIFGNVWAQDWINIFPIIKQCSNLISENNYQNEANENLEMFSVKELFQMSERYFVSIGMYKMTNEFWERSVVTQPPNVLVDCHGSAYDFHNGFDYRILMCTKQNLDDFTTIHHEMGHIQYYMAYSHLPYILRDSANSGFHEAIGDTIALAVKTPEHLQKIGLISEIPMSDDFDIEYLMATALEKVVFLPFALTMDSYIWGIYNGSVPVSKLNEHWWNLRYRFQGIKPPIERSENDFDAGAKYHIAFGVPYIRYFVSFIIQFQFYESMCKISGHEGPLHRCDFYKSKEAGSKMLEMLKEGQSQHWRKTIKLLTGDDKIVSDSLLKFFDPLYKWLKKRNEELNIYVGW